MSTACRAIIRGIPNIPTVREVNVRSGPHTSFALVFKAPVADTAFPVMEVQPDSQGAALNGKQYQWFRLSFPDGRTGFVRDDLLDLIGDCAVFGYERFTERTFAFDRTRSLAPAVTTPAQPTPPTPVPPVAPPPQVMMDDLNRVRRAAFAITETFEGKGYAAYQNYDSGIVSYGRFQFTLAAGTLATVVNRFVERSNSPVAQELRHFQHQLVARDHSLRHNMRLKDLLIAAAEEPQMKQVQNDLATENYWDRMLNLSARPRSIQAPLSIALLFDIAINFGVMHSLLTMSEEALKVPPRSRVGENGITEQQLITKVAELRKLSHDRQAERDNLPGLRVRGDFWVNLVASGDWGLQGDSSGVIRVKGRPLQVRNPAEF